MGLGLDGVNKVGELHSILNEEDRNVVSAGGSQLEPVMIMESKKAHPTISQFPSEV